jgi:hypothetical protein
MDELDKKLAWGAKVSPEFRVKVLGICDAFGWPASHASYLMSCMAFETGESFSPSIKNAAGSGAQGLIQFMPATAKGLGCTTDQLACMSPEEQLDWVARYFRPYAHKIHNLADCYMAILMPKYVGKPDDTVIFSGGIAYRQNSGLDANHDGKITKGEAAAKVQAKLNKGLRPGYAHNWEK